MQRTKRPALCISRPIMHHLSRLHKLTQTLHAKPLCIVSGIPCYAMLPLKSRCCHISCSLTCVDSAVLVNCAPNDWPWANTLLSRAGLNECAHNRQVRIVKSCLLLVHSHDLKAGLQVGKAENKVQVNYNCHQICSFVYTSMRQRPLLHADKKHVYLQSYTQPLSFLSM